MSDLVIETTGLRKVYRSGGRRIVAVDGLDLERPAPAACTASSVPTAPARPPRSRCCSDSPGHAGRDAALRAPGARPAAPGHRPGRRHRRGTALSPHLLRPQEPQPARRADRRPAHRSTRRSSRPAWPTGPRRYRSYSLGMKQRLAIAAALLKSPRPADPRRADQRARPGRHPGHPRD